MATPDLSPLVETTATVDSGDGSGKAGDEGSTHHQLSEEKRALLATAGTPERGPNSCWTCGVDRPLRSKHCQVGAHQEVISDDSPASMLCQAAGVSLRMPVTGL